MLSIQHSRPPLRIARNDKAPEGIHLTGPGSTSFVGYTPEGPLEEPLEVSSETEFQSLFGAERQADPLAAALRGFFRNGGRTAWVCRIAAPAAGHSSVAMLHRGLETLRNIPGLALVTAPGWTTGHAHRLLLEHCESTRRLALLDAPPRLDGGLPTLLPSSSFGACFHPWLLVSGGDEEPVEIPPSGHIAGLLSRLERETGVQRTSEQEVLRATQGVGVCLTSHEARQLRAAGVNSVRDLSARGVRLCSSTTCSQDALDLATRRLMNLVSDSVERGTSWRSLTDNDRAARERLLREVTELLRRLQESGVLSAAPPTGEPPVRCDESNNPASVIAADRIICDLPIGRRRGEPVPLRITLKVGQALQRAGGLRTESG